MCVDVTETDDLTVTYTLTGGWQLSETHVWVGFNDADMPQTRKGSPKIGNFPHNSGDLAGVTTHTETIALSDLGFSCPSSDRLYYVAAHAAVFRTNADGTVQTETGWSNGPRITSKGSWATISAFTVTCNCEEDPEEPPTAGPRCETAWARDDAEFVSNTCFLDIDEDGDEVADFNRWGWTVGPIEEGQSGTLTLYGGAGQCDTSKGVVVGTFDYQYTAGSVFIQWSLDNAGGWQGESFHLYVGAGMLPLKNGYATVSPGQFPFNWESDPEGTYVDGPDYGTTPLYSYTVHGQEGPVFIAAHSAVCGPQ